MIWLKAIKSIHNIHNIYIVLYDYHLAKDLVQFYLTLLSQIYKLLDELEFDDILRFYQLIYLWIDLLRLPY